MKAGPPPPLKSKNDCYVGDRWCDWCVWVQVGGSVVQQMGCHLVSSVLLDKPVPNYLSHNPRYKGVGVPKRLRKFEISIFTTSSTSPASTATRAPLLAAGRHLTPPRSRGAHGGALTPTSRPHGCSYGHPTACNRTAERRVPS